MARNAITIREVACEKDAWPIVDEWAQDAGYRLVEKSGGSRVYRKGVETRVRLTSSDGKVTVEAWLEPHIFQRVMTLFVVPKVMGIESGGVVLKFPRDSARKNVNELIEELSG